MEKYVAKKDNLMLFKAFSINLTAQHSNGMTHFDLLKLVYGYKIL